MTEQEREKAWDYCSGSQLDSRLGIERASHEDIPILSDSEAYEYIEAVNPDQLSLESYGRCNCEERLRRTAIDMDNVRMPDLRDDGVCLGCGVLR